MRQLPPRVLIVPAAGRGTRLGAPTPKALAPLAGKPMIQHVLERHRGRFVLAVPVVQPGMEGAVEAVAQRAGVAVRCVVQASPTGMLDAVLLASEAVRATGGAAVWITWCDQVAIRSETLDTLEQALAGEDGHGLALATAMARDPYIHLERDAEGAIVALRQRREGDPMPPVGESDAGLFALTRRTYLEDLPAFAAHSEASGRTGERNFLPFIPWLAARFPGSVRTFPCRDAIEALGVNTPDDLARVEAYLVSRRPQDDASTATP